MTADLKVLQTRIESKSARLAVIGLGYVGLTVACKFAEVGFQVTGLDVKAERVEKINSGLYPSEDHEPGLPQLLAQVVSCGRLRATTNYTVCRENEAFLISVETPVEQDTRLPVYRALQSALASLGANLPVGSLVIVESTLAPGTIRDLVAPVLGKASGLKAGEDFWFGHCPERVMPGKLLANLTNCARVVGGMTPAVAETMAALYSHVVQGELALTDPLTAELVKTGENAYRDVQIAFANELALLCEALGADVWEVRALINKSPGRHVHLPGAGVGGHCIPKDPWLLIANIHHRHMPRLIPTARAVNDAMPEHIVSLTTEALARHHVPMNDAQVGVLGYSYLENSDDVRNSPSEVVVRQLRAMGAKVRVHDPFVPEYAIPLEQVATSADALILMVVHDVYRMLDLGALSRLMRTPVLVDGRRLFSADSARNAGLELTTIGVGR